MTGPSDRPLPRLPVTEALPRVLSALGREGAAVLVAPPGAGKTTVVPLALLGDDRSGGGKILVLEPRRLAARAAAHRMASLLGEPDVGGTVGYRVRRDTRVGPDTRIEVVTEGVLTRMLQRDPALGEVDVVIFDEFHERSLHADLGLALTLQTRALFRNDLRVLVMSATLRAEPVAHLLGGAPVVRSEGREHPVETRWLDRPVEGWIEPVVADAVVQALREVDGDVLVFLPGAREIRHAAEHLSRLDLPEGTAVHRLHGSLSRAAQDRAIAPASAGRRKVVLSSAVAETSLTIEGVHAVVDAGRMRVPRFDPGTGMTRLETVRVTRDSADQRRGRAGRLGPGLCFRLWTRGEDRGLVPRRTPEILEADLAPLMLDLATWGAGPEELRWLDAPPRAAMAQASELLGELELIDEDGVPTEHGREVAELGLHPRLGHMLLRARGFGFEELGCELAALLEARDPIRGEGRLPDADLRLRVEALRRAGRGGGGGFPGGAVPDRRALMEIRREAAHLRRSLPKARRSPTQRAPRREGDQTSAVEPGLLARPTAAVEPGPLADSAAAAGLLSALAYPDRVGRRREGSRGRFLLRGGRGARFHEPQSLEGAEWLVAVEVEGRGREARILRAAPLTREEVEAHFAKAIETTEEVVWDEAAERVRAARVRRLGAVEISRAPLELPDPEQVALVLLEAIRSRDAVDLPWARETVQLRQRMHFLHRLHPEAWPDSSEAALLASLGDWLLPFLAGIRSFGDLKRVDLREALLARAPAGGRLQLEREAPSHLEVPSGSNLPLDYSDPGAPALAVRLQEVFGLTETPRVGGGRVPLTLELLSPAHRPVQVTQDLSSFWESAYFEVRKDLRGRYPKHHWPADPLKAEPTRRTRRR